MIWFLLACTVPAFLVSTTATGLMRRWAPRWGLIDQPAARKVHTTPTPLGGGVGIYCGFVIPVIGGQLFASWLARLPEIPDWIPLELAQHVEGLASRTGSLWMLIGAGTLLAVAGLLDDLKPLPWQPRLLLQFAVAGGLVAGGIRATLFVDLPWIGIVFSVMWIVLLINSMNFLDNMDGLSGGIAFIAAVVFSVVMLTLPGGPRWLVAGGLLVLAGATAGFLIHNRAPARIFMGDSGSMFLGMMLASLTMLGTFYDANSPGQHTIIAPLLVLAVPLYDTISVIFIRLRQGRSPFQADKSHFSHRLVELGLSKPGAVRMVHLATLTTSLAALLLYQVSNWTAALILTSQVLAILAIVAAFEMTGRRSRSEPSRPVDANSLAQGSASITNNANAPGDPENVAAVLLANQSPLDQEPVDTGTAPDPGISGASLRSQG
ncbi:MAG: MraY family glycosyltransferase [Planctomycetaceae bacterium]